MFHYLINHFCLACNAGLLLWDASEMAVCAISKARGDYMWPKHFAALEKYAIEHGHCNVRIPALRDLCFIFTFDCNISVKSP